MRDKNAIIICALICATLIIGGVFFWPSLFRYDKIEGKFLVRINRLTGYTEILYNSGWKREVSDKELQAIPKEEIAKVEIRGSFDGEEHYKFDVYNGCDWNIKKIKLSIGLKDGNGKKLWERIYETTADIWPFSIGSCSTKLMDNAPKTFNFIPYYGTVIESPSKAPREIKGHWGPPIDKSKIYEPEVRIEEAYGYKSK